MFDYLLEIIGALRRNLLRTLATGFAVASGLFLLIVLQGAGNGIIHTFEQNSEGFSFDAIHVYPGFTSIPFEGMKEGRMIQLDDDDKVVSETSFPNEVELAVTQVSQSATSASVGENYLSNVTLEGVYPEAKELEAIKMAEGRFINKIDLDEQRKVIVISEKNRKDLFKHGEKALNRHVRVGSVSYMVVGVFKTDEMDSDNSSVIFYHSLNSRAIVPQEKENIKRQRGRKCGLFFVRFPADCNSTACIPSEEMIQLFYYVKGGHKHDQPVQRLGVQRNLVGGLYALSGGSPSGPPAPHGKGVFPALCRAPGLRDGLRLPAEAGHPRRISGQVPLSAV